MLTFTAPAATVSGTVDVVLFNDPGVNSTPPLPYSYDNPSITATSPATAGTAVTVSGSGWPASTTVTLELHGPLMEPLGGQVIVRTTAAGAVPPTSVLTPVSTPAQRVELLATDSFGNPATTHVLVLAPPPVATGVEPRHGPLTGGNSVTLTGSAFRPDATVTVDGITITPSSINSAGTQLTIKQPAASVAGAVQVVVRNGSLLAATPLTYTYDAPTIVAADLMVAGGDVQVSGDGLPAATAVTIGPQRADRQSVGEPITVSSAIDGSLPSDTVIKLPVSTPGGTPADRRSRRERKPGRAAHLCLPSGSGPPAPELPAMGNRLMMWMSITGAMLQMLGGLLFGLPGLLRRTRRGPESSTH